MRHFGIVLTLIFFALFSHPLQGFGADANSAESLFLQAQQALKINEIAQALQLAEQAAPIAKEQGNKDLEIRVREFLVELLRGSEIFNHIISYRKQLDRLEALHELGEPPFTEAKTLLHLLQAELAFITNSPTEGTLHAQKAQVAAEALHNHVLLSTAKILHGLAKFQSALHEKRSDDLQGVIQGQRAHKPSTYKETKDLLALGLKGTIHPKFKNLEFPIQLALFSIAIQAGDLELAQQILDRFPETSSMLPIQRAIRIYSLAVWKFGNNQVEEVKLLVKQAHEVLESEKNAQAKSQIYWTIAIPLCLAVGLLDQATQMFQWSLNTLQESPESIQLLLQSLQAEIIPMLERRNLSQLGVEFLEQVLSMPAISESPEFSYPIYPALGRFYAKSLDIISLETLLNRFVKQRALYPNWEVAQSLAFSFAEILKTKDAELTKSFYRKAIKDSWRIPQNRFSFPEVGAYFLHAIRKAMKLALEIGNYQDAVDFATLGLTSLSYEWLEESEAEKEAAIWFLVDAGEVLTKIGRIDLAIDAIEFAIGRQSNTTPGWANRIALGAADLFALLGDFDFSREHLITGLKGPFVGRGIEDKAAEYWFQLAKVQYALGDYLRAEKNFRACIASATTLIIQPSIEGECRAYLGYLWLMMNDEEGWDEWLKGIELFARNLFKAVEVQSLTDQGIIGTYKADRELIDLWLESAQTSLDILSILPPTVRNQTRRSLVLSQKALLNKFRGGEPSNLEQVELESLLAAVVHEPYISKEDFQALTFTARNLRDMGHYVLAISLMENIVQRLEYVRSVTPDLRSQLYLGAGMDQAFDLLVELILANPQVERSKRVREALIISDANRGRSVIGKIYINKPVVPGLDMAPSTINFIRARLEKTLREVRLGKQIRPLVEVREDWRTFLIKLTIDNEQKDSINNLLEQPQQRPIPRLDLASVQRQLDPTTAILVYHFTNELPGAWVITPDQVEWVPLEDWQSIQEAILHFRTEILATELSWESRISLAGKRVFSALLNPLLQLVPQVTHLVIIPDRSAFVIPFEAMVIADGPDEGKYLIEKFDISYQLSLELIRHLKESNQNPRPRLNSILLVGNPDFGELNRSMPVKLMPLPGTQYELEAIRQVVGAENVELYMGAQATRAQFTKAIGEAGIVHVATHGVVQAQRPWESFLAFSGPTGKLPLTDITSLNTSADLVVLSACDTGRGKVLEGEGVWGFQAQFLAAGAKNVLASLWRVGDDSTANFMADLYRQITNHTTSYAASLRQAKLDLMKNQQWRHPKFWAPFILYGAL